MTYKFESYSDTHMVLGIILGTALCLLGILGAIFLVEAAPKLESYEDYVFITISILILAVLWLLTKKYLVQKSTITLKNDLVIFQRKSSKKELKISDIASYKYKLFHGVRLVIWTRYNEKIVIHANDYFCDHEELELFCSDFDNYVATLKSNVEKPSVNVMGHDALNSTVPCEEKTIYPVYEKVETESHLSVNAVMEDKVEKKEPHNQIPERKRSFYERKYAIAVLVSFTLLGIAFIIYVIIDGGNLPGTFIAGFGGISAMWAAYLNHKSK